MLFALTLAAVVATPPPARTATADASADSVTQSLDAAARTLVGTWSAPGAPSVAIVVAPPVGPNRETEIHAPTRFRAIGHLADSTFVGIWRPEDANGRADSWHAGLLIVRAAGGGQLEARFATLDPGSAWHAEFWRREQTHEAAREAPAGNDSLPAFGTYRYVETLPEAISRVTPVYPPLARQQGVQGTVMLQVLVGADGTVRDIRVVRSIPELDQAAIDCVRQWRFKPATSKGEPVAVWVAVPVKFVQH